MSMLSVSFLAIFEVEATLRSKTVDTFKKIAEELYYTVNDVMAKGARDVALVSKKSSLTDENHSSESLKDELVSLKQMLKVYRDITFINSDGDVVASTGYNYWGDWKQRKEFKNALAGKTSFSNVLISPDFSTHIINISSPVYKNSEVYAVVVIQLDIRDIISTISHFSVDKTGYAFLLDQDDRIIAHYNKELVLTNLNSEIKRQINSLATEISFVENQKKMLGAFFTKHRQQSIKPINNTAPDWKIVIVQAEQEVYLPLSVTRWRIIRASTILFLVVILLGMYFSRTITRPIEKLIFGATKIGEGDLSHRVEITSKDEIGHLAESFNHMAEQLTASNWSIQSANNDLEEELSRRMVAEKELLKAQNELEKRVDERTKELIETNIRLKTEISERKDVQKALLIEKEHAEIATRAKSEFLANMSHEIRTPMNAILGFAEILEKEIVDSQHKKYLETINSSGKTLLNLINDILDLSKIEAGKLDLNPTPISLRSISEEIGAIFSQKLDEKGLDYKLDIDPNIPEAVMLDEVRLRQILFNLVGNAIKFTEVGSIELALKVISHNDDSNTCEIIITVSDTGIGIADDQAVVIFEAFHQQNTPENTFYGGTGLGLAITKRLVEMMNGIVSVDSEVNVGSTFLILFKNVVISKKDLMFKQESSRNAAKIDFMGAKVLIVDDIDTNRELLKSYLNNHNVKIIEAVNGQDGIEKARKEIPDVILMDMKMPVMNGYMATRTIKNDPDLKKIPIVAITASVMKENESKIMEAGCDSYLRKPVAFLLLLKELGKYLANGSSKEIVVEEVEVEKSNEIQLKIDDIDRFFEQLDRQLENLKIVRKTSILDSIEEFGSEVLNLGEKFNISDLSRWAEELNSEVLNFQIKKAHKLLEQFPELVDRIKRSV